MITSVSSLNSNVSFSALSRRQLLKRAVGTTALAGLGYYQWRAANLEDELFEPPDEALQAKNQRAFKALKAKEIQIESSNNVKLHAWYIAPKPGADTVVFSNGNDGDFDKTQGFMEQLVKKGFGVLAYEYPGFGLSTGKPNQESLLAAVGSASDYLSKGSKEIEKTPLDKQVWVGYSLGTMLTPIVAKDRTPKALALIAPFKNMKEAYRATMAEEGLALRAIAPGGYRLDGYLDPQNALEKIRKKGCSVLLIGANGDLTATPDSVKDYGRQNNVPSMFLPGDHDTIFESHEKLANAVEKLTQVK